MSKTAQVKKLTSPDIRQAKGGDKLVMLTAYDHPSAIQADASGADILLVGDSLAMVVLGREDTLSLTMDEMLHHCRPVSAAAKRALVVGDMPFMSYQESVEQAVHNAGRLVTEGGVRAVKLEGANHLEHIKAILDAGIPVMGHVGLTPQFVAQFGGFKVQGKTSENAQQILNEAKALEALGCFALVIEAVPSDLAAAITEAVSIPTIGIGAGPDCDGQVLVYHDVLGLFERFVPKFVKQYATLGPDMQKGLEEYGREVREGIFPAAEHSFASIGFEAKDAE